MLDEIANNDFEPKPDPRELYCSQVIPKSVEVMSWFAGPDGIIDIDIAIEKMIGLATNDIPAAKSRCAQSDAQDFIFQYVHHFMGDDLFVARARVSMLQHVLAQTNVATQPMSLIEQALASGGGDRHAKEVQSVCNTADHHAMRLQLIRAFTNEAVLRVMCSHMVIQD